MGISFLDVTCALKIAKTINLELKDRGKKREKEEKKRKMKER